MKTMVDEVMEELTQNARDYGLEGATRKLPRRTVLRLAVTKICGNTRNHYREFVHDLLFWRAYIHMKSATRQHLQKTKDTQANLPRNP